MFIIEGMNKVREVIEKNRKRKLTKHKKQSNNTIIEIDNCSPLELLKLQINLKFEGKKEKSGIEKNASKKQKTFLFCGPKYMKAIRRKTKEHSHQKIKC